MKISKGYCGKGGCENVINYYDNDIGGDGTGCICNLINKDNGGLLVEFIGNVNVINVFS